MRLPQGAWHDFWTGVSHVGPGEITALAPLDRLPLFVRGGALLPMGPPLASIPDGHVFDELSIHAWPPFTGETSVYDDDGRTRAYERGEFSRMLMECTQEEGRLRLRVHPTQGESTVRPARIKMEAVFHGASTPQVVNVDGVSTREWDYNAVSRALRVHWVVSSNQGCELMIGLAG